MDTVPNLEVVREEFSGGNYFTTSDVRPYIRHDGALVLYGGAGAYKSWGRWSVRSDLFYVSPTLVKVSVVGWHKFTVRPVGGVYYFVFERGEWRRRSVRYHAVVAALEDQAASQDG